jgi:hypothetical protein
MWKLILVMSMINTDAVGVKTNQHLGGFELAKYSTQAECVNNVAVMENAQPSYSYYCQFSDKQQ